MPYIFQPNLILLLVLIVSLFLQFPIFSQYIQVFLIFSKRFINDRYKYQLEILWLRSYILCYLIFIDFTRQDVLYTFNLLWLFMTFYFLTSLSLLILSLSLSLLHLFSRSSKFDFILTFINVQFYCTCCSCSFTFNMQKSFTLSSLPFNWHYIIFTFIFHWLFWYLYSRVIKPIFF